MPSGFGSTRKRKASEEDSHLEYLLASISDLTTMETSYVPPALSLHTH
jgi:hypothetical protein